MGIRRLVHPLAHQRVIGVRQAHRLHGHRYLVALQPVGIASAVHPLVMPAADLRRSLHQWLAFHLLHAPHQFLADQGMLLDLVKLLRRQGAGLSQQGIRHAHLSDVVEHSRGGGPPAVLQGQAVFIRAFQHSLQQPLRDLLHVPPVVRALAVAVAHHPRQDIRRDAHHMLLPPQLLRHHRCQPPLPRIQLHGVHHPLPHDTDIKGPFYVVRHAHVVGLPHLFF